MRVLLIKMSSMGDVFHSFPALSDAMQHVSGLTVDWVVEKGFSDIPNWHPVVNHVFPIELRRWRKSLFSSQTRREIKAFFGEVNQAEYDLIIDAQGLLKSAWVCRKIKAPIAGYDWFSVREALASQFYQHKYPVAKDEHAIFRIRQLFAQALNYDVSHSDPIVYGLATEGWKTPQKVVEQCGTKNYWVGLHSTTWDTKLWPEAHWLELLQKVHDRGVNVILPWGSDEEKQRSLRLKETAESESKTSFIWVPEQRLSLHDMGKMLKNAQAVISVDTGLSHVAAALEVPMVVLYRVTDPKLVGASGQKVMRLASPCAPLYLKKFDNGSQVKESLQGLSAGDVMQTALTLLE